MDIILLLLVLQLEKLGLLKKKTVVTDQNSSIINKIMAYQLLELTKTVV